MGFSELFTDIITKLESIPSDTIVQNTKPANNFQKTPTNVNQKFKMINIWNDQIDNEIKENGYIVRCPAIFIEFLPEEPKLILGGVTQYMDAKIYFHIYSDKLNTSNSGVNSFGDNSGDLMDANFEIYELRDTIKSVFLGFHTHNSSAMMSRYDSLDYRHKTITKYLLGFTFCFNDDKGSIYDPKSSRYQIIQGITNPILNSTPQQNWISGTTYVQNVNVVFVTGIAGVANGYYLCITSNSDLVFVTSEWQQLALWVTAQDYAIGAYIYNGYFAYICITANSDVVFDAYKWTLITKI